MARTAKKKVVDYVLPEEEALFISDDDLDNLYEIFGVSDDEAALDLINGSYGE